MAWKKRDYIIQAFSEIGLASYVFDLGPDQLQTALRQLDMMMATWDGKGIKLGWPLSLSPGNSDLDTEVESHLWADEAICLNLALRIAPGFGKAVGQEAKTNAKLAYDAVLVDAARPRQMQYPGTLPAGAGNKPWREYGDPFMPQPNDDPLQECGAQLVFVGD
jgi:hypothetical protein